MAIELHLFGRPRVEAEGRSFDLDFERRHQLLVFLAMKNAWVGRAELAAMLWPGVASKLALANLRKTLFRLDALSWAPKVQAQGNALRFEAGTDVARFEAALRDGHAADALAFRATDFLAGFDDDASESWSAWVGFQRERLRSAWRAAAVARLESGIDTAEALEITARMREADPIDEDAVRLHMRRLAEAGQVAAARRAFDEFAQRLKDEFGLVPGAELQVLHDALSPVAPVRIETITPRVTADESFIGRARELRQIGDTLAGGDCRMLCIVGPGGAGKTRLARRALQEFGGRYADGTVFVPLDSVDTAAEIGPAIARALGATLDDIAEAIEYLRDREMLAVLDNFEHLAHVAPQIQRVVDECPRLQVIVTSRVRLGLASEWSLALEGLPCPDPEDRDRLDAFDAARLFVRSAQRMDPTLSAGANAEAIIAICREVEGLPLALELAATWTRVLPCDAIAAELREGTQLLRTQDPSRPARHGSMEIVFEHSWSLLGTAEREALARLSVFRGGFTADAALRVASAPLPVLASLIDKSLLRKDGQRLTQHPLIQQLSALRLESGARGEVEAKHARYFHDLLEQSEGAQPGERDALLRIDAEFENCRAAWQWSMTHGDTQGIAASVATLRSYCEHRARTRDGVMLMRAAVDSGEAMAAIAPLRIALGQLEYRMDRYPEAFAEIEAALVLLKGKRDWLRRVACMQLTGSVNLRLGQYEEARRAYLEALRLTPETHTRLQAVVLDHLALVEKRMGRFAESIEMSRRALEQFRAVGYYAGEALCLNNMAALLNDTGDTEAGRAYLKMALAVCERHGFVGTRTYVLANLVECDLLSGNFAAARATAEAALELAQAGGYRWIEASLWLYRARIALRGGGDVALARADLQRGADLANAIAQPSVQLEAIMCFGELLHAQGHRQEAINAIGFALGHEAATALDRVRADYLLKRWRIPFEPTKTALSFAELAQRIGTEASLEHAPLIASLRAH